MNKILYLIVAAILAAIIAIFVKMSVSEKERDNVGNLTNPNQTAYSVSCSEWCDNRVEHYKTIYLECDDRTVDINFTIQRCNRLLRESRERFKESMKYKCKVDLQ